MILAEELTCRPASAYAEKQDVIYCSTTATGAAELWGVGAAWVTAIATVGLVIGALVAWQTAKRTLEQMKADSAAEARPYVHAQIVPSIGGNRSWDLLIKNTGRSAARNLQITISEWPPEDQLTKDLRTLFESGQTLPPQSTIRQYWNLGVRGKHGSTGSTGFDIATIMTVTYEGSEPGNVFQESYTLDVHAFNMTPMGFKGVNLANDATATEKKLSEIVAALNNMRREIRDS